MKKIAKYRAIIGKTTQKMALSKTLGGNGRQPEAKTDGLLEASGDISLHNFAEV